MDRTKECDFTLYRNRIQKYYKGDTEKPHPKLENKHQETRSNSKLQTACLNCLSRDIAPGVDCDDITYYIIATTVINKHNPISEQPWLTLLRELHRNTQITYQQ